MFNATVFSAPIPDARLAGTRRHIPNPSVELAIGTIRRIERHVHAQPVILAQIERAHDRAFAFMLFVGIWIAYMGNGRKEMVDMNQLLQRMWQIRE